MSNKKLTRTDFEVVEAIHERLLSQLREDCIEWLDSDYLPGLFTEPINDVGNDLRNQSELKQLAKMADHAGQLMGYLDELTAQKVDAT